MLNLMIRHFLAQKMISLVLLIVLICPLNSLSQCDFIGTVTVSTTGYEAGTDYYQGYVLVDDASDNILALNTTGTFTNLSGTYRIYAINYRDSLPSVVAVGNTWATIATYDGDANNCFDASTPYNGGAVTVCESICNGDNISVSTTGYETGTGYSQIYVLVNSSGTILGDTTSGVFTPAYYGNTNGEYSVYAVNTDDATVIAEIDDLGLWSDVSAMVSPATCTDILGPRIMGVEACCTPPTVTFTVAPDCSSNQFNIQVNVTNLGDAATVNVKDGTTTHQSGVGTGSYTVGPYTSGSTQVITVEDAADITCATVSTPQSFSCLTLSACNTAGGTSVLIDENFNSAVSGWTMGNWAVGTSGGAFPVTATGSDYLYLNDANTNLTNNPTTAYSPTVDASASDSLSLEFDYVFRQYASFYDDYLQVDVYDGSSWNTIFSIGGSADTENQSWTSQSYDVTAYKNTSFQVRFRFGDDGSWAYWAGIDNVKLTSVAATTEPDVVLTASSLTAYPQCNDGNWTYYAVDATSQYVFAINWATDGSLSANNQNARDASYVELTLDGAYHQASSLVANAEEATFTMSRYWNVDFSSAYVMDEDVNVRFFYNPVEKTTIETAATAFAGLYPNTYDEGFAWFKTTSGTFNPSSNVTATQVNGVMALTAAANGTTNSVDYVQFNSLSSFSGGTGASGAGPLGGAPLPVEGLELAAKPVEAINEISWSTLTEINTAVHQVEKSQDGIHFELVGEVEAAGFSNQKLFYSLEDHNPGVKTFYRITTVDRDGSANTSHMVLVERTADGPSIVWQTFPNPFRESFTLRLDLPSDADFTFKITDVSGRIIEQRNYMAVQGWNDVQFNLAGQAKGIYFVSIATNGVQKVTRIVKN